jgi:CheY-like chemotaxis protein
MTTMSLAERIVNTDRDPAEDVGQRPLLLLAEGDAHVSEVTALALKATGNYEVVEVSGVQEALAQMGTMAFAVLLLDPRVDGMQDMRAVEALYLLADRARCPVIAFSDIPFVDLGLAYPFGFAGVVTKPFWALDLGAQVGDISARFAADHTKAGGV